MGDEPVQISGKRNSAVLVSEEDWRAIQKTIYLSSIPGIRASERRKSFRVDEALAFVLVQTDLDVTWSDLRVPFPCFALVFTDRQALSLAERMLSAEAKCPLAGYILRMATVYVTEVRRDPGRALRVHFAFDALGADPPHVVLHEMSLAEDAMVEEYLGSLLPQTLKNLQVADSYPLSNLRSRSSAFINFNLLFSRSAYRDNRDSIPAVGCDSRPVLS